MTTPNSNDSTSRRALVAADDDGERVALAGRLRAAGYETRAEPCADAPAAAAEFAPDVLLAVAGGGVEGLGGAVALVRRLRTEAATHALPVVVLFREDARSLRSAAAGVGADDYFALDSAAEELRARLEALFWRAEAGRRASPTEQREEIDNFLLLLDAVRSDASDGDRRGSVALVACSTRSGGDAGTLLREAHGFLKLNLRRLDAVAFYGPTLLFVYQPGRDANEARNTLARLADEFETTRPRARLLTGAASFPDDGRGVEQLIETTERRLERAREDDSETAHAPAASRAARMINALDASTRTLLGERRVDAATRENRTTGGDPRGVHAGGGVAFARRVLLVVSDASLMARLNLLLRSAGAEVRAAFDARQALGLLRIERPDLVLVAETLADMQGVEMLRRLAATADNRLASGAVLLVTNPSGRAAGEAAEIGANAVACVPYNPEEILDGIRRAASRAD
ncbi:MAG TPA: response regulator [Pyrinomonadaceae bacterium]|nr:response regulator [Pyrinomonadaceae bacterium]